MMRCFHTPSEDSPWLQDLPLVTRYDDCEVGGGWSLMRHSMPQWWQLTFVVTRWHFVPPMCLSL